MKPLCVDCDGTLIRSDLLHECLLRVLLTRPWLLWKLLPWLLRGRAYVKSQLARVAQVDCGLLPFRNEVMEMIKKHKSLGGLAFLVTASHESLARRVAIACGYFEEVFASNEMVNLKGAKKAVFLVERFGQKGFDYAGDSNSDFPVWASADTAIIVGRGSSFAKKVAKVNHKMVHIKKYGSLWGAWFKLIRLHQWAKNLIIFVPLVTSHRIFDLPVFCQAFMAFVAFSFLASVTYIFNDLCDLENDRAHAKKFRRPLAYGSVGLPTALFSAIVLLLISVTLGFYLGWHFLAVLLIYFLVSLFYSSTIKKLELIDVIVLAGFYIWRLVAGGVATGTVLSNWLLSFALFVFISLALAKRYVELSEYLPRDVNGTNKIKGRGYLECDLPLVFGLGISAAMVSVLVVLLYVNSPEVVLLYTNPQFLFILAPLILFWISRIWLLALRKEMNEDPVVFALKDKWSYFTAACMVFVGLSAKFLLKI